MANPILNCFDRPITTDEAFIRTEEHAEAAAMFANENSSRLRTAHSIMYVMQLATKALDVVCTHECAKDRQGREPYWHTYGCIAQDLLNGDAA